MTRQDDSSYNVSCIDNSAIEHRLRNVRELLQRGIDAVQLIENKVKLSAESPGSRVTRRMKRSWTALKIESHDRVISGHLQDLAIHLSLLNQLVSSQSIEGLQGTLSRVTASVQPGIPPTDLQRVELESESGTGLTTFGSISFDNPENVRSDPTGQQLGSSWAATRNSQMAPCRQKILFQSPSSKMPPMKCTCLSMKTGPYMKWILVAGQNCTALYSIEIMQG